MERHEIEGAILECLLRDRPQKILALVETVARELATDKQHVLRVARRLKVEGMIPVVDERKKRVFSLDPIAQLISMIPVVGKVLEPVVKGPTFKIILLVLISWLMGFMLIVADLLVPGMHENPAIVPIRVLILGPCLLFNTGCLLELLLHPLNTEKSERAQLAEGTRVRFVTRLALSLVYSTCLTIMLGFFIALLGAGFNVMILLASLGGLSIILCIAILYRQIR